MRNKYVTFDQWLIITLHTILSNPQFTTKTKPITTKSLHTTKCTYTRQCYDNKTKEETHSGAKDASTTAWPHGKTLWNKTIWKRNQTSTRAGYTVTNEHYQNQPEGRTGNERGGGRAMKSRNSNEMAAKDVQKLSFHKHCAKHCAVLKVLFFQELVQVEVTVETYVRSSVCR